MNNCPRVLMSQCQHSRQGIRANAVDTPLHVIPYRVELCVAGRHVVGASSVDDSTAGEES